MNNTMIFPETVDEFMEQYKLVDKDGVYSNGSEFVPIFRMKQWFEHQEPNLNLYFVVFAIHVAREWRAYSGYMFAKSETDIPELLNKKYGEVSIKTIQPIEIKEGKILYGELWRSFD